MKVVFITREGYRLAGARVRCYRFAEALKRYGVATEVFSFADHLGAFDGEREAEMSFVRKLAHAIEATRALARNVKEVIFFVQRLNYHTLAPFLVSLKGRNRFIFDCDDWNIREDPRYYLGFYPSSKMEFLTRKIARFAFLCIAASRFLEEYVSAFNRRVYYVPTAVDTDVFTSGLSKRDRGEVHFSWIGTAYHQEMKENVEFILECFSALSARHNNVFLHLAGEGRYFKEIAVRIRSESQNGNIIIHDWIQPDDMPSFLADMDVGLLPLIQDSKFNKAKSPTKLFEYMAMSKAVIASSIGESAHVIQDGKNGLLADSKDEFITKMELVASNRSLRQDLGDCARTTAEEKYSLRVLGKQLYEIIRTACVT